MGGGTTNTGQYGGERTQSEHLAVKKHMFPAPANAVIVVIIIIKDILSHLAWCAFKFQINFSPCEAEASNQKKKKDWKK